MPRQYKRKTERAKTPRDILERASAAVQGGMSIRAAAHEFNVDRMTLKRFITKRADNAEAVTGYENCKRRNMIFTPEMEKELASHIKIIASQFHGLSKEKCLCLTYEYATQNKLKVPDSWIRNKKAGQDFWLSFKERQHLALRKPEATSLARATAFNRHTVGTFFDNLADVMDRYKFQPQDIYNVDETGCTTVQQPGSIVTEQGIKQIGSVTSAERGQLVTVTYTINASGVVLPPMFIFPRVNYHDHFIRGSPNGSIGRATKSGWMNEALFIDYLQHVITHTRCSVDHKILLILDNHKSHISINCIDTAKANGVILLTLPPHTSHRLQPLDISCYGPFKRAYAVAMDNWMRSNTGKTLTIYEIPVLVKEAHLSAMVPRNVISGFSNTGIYPFNADRFTEADYAPAIVTDRELPEDHQVDKAVPELVVDTDTDDGETDETQHASISTDQSPDRANNPDESETYVSPAVILPLPKAGPRKVKTVRRKKGSTKILTDTPVRDSIAMEHEARLQKKQPKSAKTTLFGKKSSQSKANNSPVHSSSESDADMELMDVSDTPDEDSDDILDEVPEKHEVMQDDYVIVKLAGKSRMAYYIACVENINGDDVNGVFCRRVLGRNNLDQPTFVLDKTDAASFPFYDIVRKLPKPTNVGTTSRCSNQIRFQYSLTIKHVSPSSSI